MDAQEQQLPSPQPQEYAAALPVVMVNQQRVAAPSPVVFLSQPVNDRQAFFINHPYLRRGAQFSNGCRFNGTQITILFTMGGLLIISGIVNFILGMYFAIFILGIGGILVGLGVYFLRTAKAQFNSLPPDHPDSVKYSAPCVMVNSSRRQRRGDQPTYTYTVPPMQQQMTYAPLPGGQVIYYPSQSGGQGQAYAPPMPATYHVPSAPSVYGDPISPNAGRAPSYQPSMQCSYVHENDPPPAYSDVVKDA